MRFFSGVRRSIAGQILQPDISSCVMLDALPVIPRLRHGHDISSLEPSSIVESEIKQGARSQSASHSTFVALIAVNISDREGWPVRHRLQCTFKVSCFITEMPTAASCTIAPID